MKRLRIKRLTANNFGRLGNRTVEIGEHDFVVIHGPNETGKSTLAELLAIVLAGRPSDEASLRRWVNDGLVPVSDPEYIGGSLVGGLAHDEFVASRVVGVRAALKGPRPTKLDPDVDAAVGGRAVSADRWRRDTSLTSHDEYSLRHRLTDREGDIDIKSLIESLAAGSSTGSSPAKVMAILKDQALAHVRRDGAKGKDASGAGQAEIARKEADAAYKEVLADQKLLAERDDEVAQITSRQRATAERLDGLARDKDDLLAARDVLGSTINLRGAQAELAMLPDVPDEWREGIDRRTDVEVALTKLGEAETSKRAAADIVRDLCSALGVNPDQVGAVTIEPPTLADVVKHRNTLASVPQKLASERTTAAQAAERLNASNGRLASIAEAVRLSVTQLEKMVEHPTTDTTVTDDVGAWRRDETARAAAETDVTASPRRIEQEHPAAQKPSRLVGVAMATLVASGVGAVVNRWLGAGLAVAGVVTLFLVLRRSASDEVAPPADAQAEMFARQTLDRAREVEAAARRRVQELFVELGAGECADSARAIAIRDARVEARAILAARTSDSKALSAAEDEVARLERVVQEAELDLNRIALACGVGHLGGVIDAEMVSKITSLVEARGRRDAAEHDIATLRGRLAELCGGDPLRGSDADTARSVFLDACGLHGQRAAIETTIATSTTLIETTLTSRPGARAIVDDPSYGSEWLENRLGVVTDEITALTEEMAQLQERLGGVRSQQELLSQRADLPAVVFAQQQAEVRLADEVTRGAALWLAHKLVEDVKTEVERKNQPAIVRAASELVAAVTGGDWLGLVIDEDAGVLKVQYRDGSTRVERALSSGARDVLRLAVRVAVADEHAESTGVALPLICDDPAGDVDWRRTPEILRILQRCSEKRQVFLLTHDERTVAGAVALGAVAVDLSVN